MANNNPFLVAHYEKNALTKQTAKRVQLIYKQSAEDISRSLKTLELLTPSDSLRKVYLDNLLKDISKSQDSFNKLVESTIMSSGESAGNIAVEAGNKVMRSAGLSISGAYSHVPREQVINIASGGLYGGKWSLSSSIWKNGLRTQSDIQKVVAKGLAENKSIKDIADSITKYVDPSARKPWDWGKVYPGTAQQVDYNAQRLARTMIQHSYQASLVQSQLYNPFCRGIIWYSVGIHGRTCEQCMERDGQVFPVKDLPLDHPNGLCYFEPALDRMNDVADRLADWVNGGSDSALDTYVAKAFNLDPKSLTGKRAVGAVKESTAKKAAAKQMTKAQKQKYINENLAHMKKKVLHFGSNPKTAKKNWAAIEQKLLGLSDEQLRLLSRSEGRYSVLTSKGSQAFYSEIDDMLVMPLNAIVKNDDWFTFFHELGHVIDTGSYRYMSKLKGIEKYAARTERDAEYSKKLFSFLEDDYKKLLKKDGTLRESVASDLLGANVENTAGIQDIISGLSVDNNRLWYGHNAKYWGKSGGAYHRSQVNSEAVANMFAAWVNPEAEKYMKKYFPKAYKYWLYEMKKGVKHK